MAVRFGSMAVETVVGDIAAQPDCDAVVNAANAELMPGGGVAGAIHRAAGPGLAEACRPLAPIAPGEAVITDAFELPNDYIIHCLGPVYGRDEPAAELLAGCYRQVLELADAYGIDAVAAPAISTGAFGFPMEEAARVACTTLRDEASRHERPQRWRWVLPGEDAQRAHERILEQIVEGGRA